MRWIASSGGRKASGPWEMTEEGRPAFLSARSMRAFRRVDLLAIGGVFEGGVSDGATLHLSRLVTGAGLRLH